MNKKPFDVYIAHSEIHAHFASALKHYLQCMGFRCWKIPDDLLPGEPWPEAVLRGIPRCRVMVVVYSSVDSAGSLGNNEIEIAIRHGLAILPFEFDAPGLINQSENSHWLDGFDLELIEHFKLLGLKIKRLLEVGGIEESHEFTLDGRLITIEEEKLFDKCLEIIRRKNRASQSLFQRRLKLGVNRVTRIMDILEERGIIGPANGDKDREILVNLDYEEEE